MSERAYNRMMQANETFKSSTKQKLDVKIGKFEERMKSQKYNKFATIDPELKGRQET